MRQNENQIEVAVQHCLFDLEHEDQVTPIFTTRVGTMAGVSTNDAIDAYDDIGEQIAIAIIEKNQKAYVSKQTDDATRLKLYQWFYLGEADEFDRTFEECLIVLRAEDSYDDFLVRLEAVCSPEWFGKLKHYLKHGLLQQQLF